MSELEDIKRKLREHKPELKEKYKVRKIGIFGSYVHDDHDEHSDIDVLVEFSEPNGWEIVDFKEELEDILDESIGLVAKDALKPRLESSIMDDVVYA